MRVHVDCAENAGTMQVFFFQRLSQRYEKTGMCNKAGITAVYPERKVRRKCR